MRYEDDEINLGEYFAILRENWWKIVLFSLAVGLVTLIVMFQFPDIYQATAVLTPAVDEKRPNPALGVLASFGVDIGSPSKVEDLETLFKSNDLTARVFSKYNLWPIVLPDRFDPATGKLKPCWTDRISGGEKGPRTPRDWEAIRVAKDRLDVFVNKKVGTVSVSFESRSAEGSANIVKYYLDEGKSRLQEEALDRAVKNKKFIEEQIGKTVDALTRDRLYSLYGQEVEREMMGRNREQFGFRVIDSPRIPDRKSKPGRGLVALMGTLFGWVAFSIYFVARDRRQQLTSETGHGKHEEMS
ncbi:MAG: Wzz/FepE/Etk N-terminal domain-containing protein [Deltaproteobacteria bacterium]|nr:Wzz/FepE/Etk N-terminal domain-containing protein [Candidatus Deferrimicrobium borealis]